MFSRETVAIIQDFEALHLILEEEDRIAASTTQRQDTSSNSYWF